MRRWLLIAIAALAACGDDNDSPNQGPKDAGIDAPVIDAAPDGNARAFCLDKPGSIENAPTAGLPCELFPPSSK